MTIWTDGKLKSFITSTLRAGFRKFPPKYETLKAASVGKRLNPKTKRLSEHFTCNSCKEVFPGKEVQVDHILCVTDPELGFQGWDVYIKRLFCGSDNLQVLCSDCHDLKTAQERGIRVESKKIKE